MLDNFYTTVDRLRDIIHKINNASFYRLKFLSCCIVICKILKIKYPKLQY